MTKKILVVDDSPLSIEMSKAQLEGAGYLVLTAKDGQEALDVAREEMPDGILLDLMLPILDGHKVCRMLKFDKSFENIPVIIFSAKDSAEDKRLAEQAGADLFMVKPLDLTLFNETIRKLSKK